MNEAFRRRLADAALVARRRVGRRRVLAGDGTGVGVTCLGDTDLVQAVPDGDPTGPPLTAFVARGRTPIPGERLELAPATDRAPLAWTALGRPSVEPYGLFVAAYNSNGTGWRILRLVPPSIVPEQWGTPSNANPVGTSFMVAGNALHAAFSGQIHQCPSAGSAWTTYAIPAGGNFDRLFMKHDGAAHMAETRNLGGGVFHLQVYRFTPPSTVTLAASIPLASGTERAHRFWSHTPLGAGDLFFQLRDGSAYRMARWDGVTLTPFTPTGLSSTISHIFWDARYGRAYAITSGTALEDADQYNATSDGVGWIELAGLSATTNALGFTAGYFGALATVRLFPIVDDSVWGKGEVVWNYDTDASNDILMGGQHWGFGAPTAATGATRIYRLDYFAPGAGLPLQVLTVGENMAGGSLRYSPVVADAVQIGQQVFISLRSDFDAPPVPFGLFVYDRTTGVLSRYLPLGAIDPIADPTGATSGCGTLLAHNLITEPVGPP